MMIASLPMYDLPEIRSATDKWWTALAHAFRDEGIADVSDTLWRDDDYRSAWTQSNLLLSQTCGYPLTHELRGKVSLVATPCYTAEGCKGSDYSSVVMICEENLARDICDLRGTRCVINSRNSQSGYNALRALIAPIASSNRFFGDVKVSGSHLESVAMVARGDADVAAVDCVAYALLKRYRPLALRGTRALCFTPHAPALPYISCRDGGRELLRKLHAGLNAAGADPALSDCREMLMIRGFRVRALKDYDRIVEMEAAAVRYGYADVA